MTVPVALVDATADPVHQFSHQFLVRWDGINWTDETAYVLSMAGVESSDPADRTMHTAEVSVSLDNSTRRFSVDNPASPIYPYLTHAGQKCRVLLGWSGETALFATVWIKTLNALVDEKRADLLALDRMRILGSQYLDYGPLANVRLDEVARALLVKGKLVEGTDFVLDVAEANASYAVVRDGRLATELQDIAIAEGGRIYVDPDGVIRFLNRTNTGKALRTPVTTLDRGVVYNVTYGRGGRDEFNRLVLRYADRMPNIADEVVYAQQMPLLAPSAYDPGTGKVYGQRLSIQVTAQDRVRWLNDFPVKFTTIKTLTANTAADGTGTACTVTTGDPPSTPLAAYANTVYVKWTADGPRGTLDIVSARNGPIYLTVVEIYGRPDKMGSVFGVVVDDADAQAYMDGQVLTHETENAYLPDTASALLLAQEMMWTRAAARQRLNVTDTDGIPFLHALDAFLFHDAETGQDLFLQVVSHEWKAGEEGYTSNLQTIASTPATAPVLADYLPALSMGIWTSTDAGALEWAPSDTPMIWDFFEWG